MAELEGSSSDLELEVRGSPDSLRDQSTLVEELRREISQLKEQLRFFTSLGQGCVPQASSEEDMPGPVAHVVFFDNRESVCNRQRIEEYMRGIAEDPCDSQMEVETIAPHYQPSAAEVTVGGCQIWCDCDNRTAIKVTGSVEYYGGFCLDQLGRAVEETNGEWQLPEGSRVVYPQVYLEPFWIDKYTENEEKRHRRMAIKCFNCGDDHHIKDCPEPKNAARISLRRQEFMDSLGTPGADKRYHVATPEDRFMKFEPGRISDKLRRALGIGETEYPPYIYRMRQLGYPPGYKLLAVEAALTLYDDNNEGTPSADTTKQNDEILYPGFNDTTSKTSTDGCKTKAPVLLYKLQKNAGLKTKTHDIDEELGALSDYEFEEGEIVDGEGAFIGFGLKKLLRNRSPSSEPAAASCGSKDAQDEASGSPDKEDKDTAKPKKQFSLDFPPGLVHSESECEASPKRWKALKKILEGKAKVIARH